MEIKEFLKNFADQLINTKVTDLTPQTRFKEIEEWSSLTALIVIVMVDEIYRVKLNGDDVRISETIEDLYRIVKSRI
jgi:acyl carrier protein